MKHYLLHPGSRDNCPHGVALLTVLMMLTILMLLGAAAAQMALMNEKSSRNGRDREIAFQAAEAALHDAMLDLSERRGSINAFPTEMGVCHAQGAHAGLCLSAGGYSQQSMALEKYAVEYGSFTGRHFAHGNGTLAIQAPRYLIELLRFAVTPKHSDAATNTVVLRYRITAIGFGPRLHNRVVVQVIHVATANDLALRIGARLSWRELNDT